MLDSLDELDGVRGAYLLRRTAGTRTEYANVSPAARAVLDDVDERVRHFTVVVTPR